MFLFGYSVLIEIFQHFIPNRGFSLLDILANTVGLLCGLALVKIVRSGRVNPRPLNSEHRKYP
jgi:VanZ family protein